MIIGKGAVVYTISVMLAVAVLLSTASAVGTKDNARGETKSIVKYVLLTTGGLIVSTRAVRYAIAQILY